MPSSSCDDGQPQQAGAATSLSFPITAEAWDEKFKDTPDEESEQVFNNWLKQQAVGEAFGHEKHLTDKVKRFIIDHFDQLAANGVVLGLNVETTSRGFHLTTYLHKECDELEEMTNDCQIHGSACPRKMTKEDLFFCQLWVLDGGGPT
ncbi:hypothetical protein COCC4DRAFT_54870 [Bipolaris maydis ATCC 48331]|uniref:Uncharacterized protein n=2 Tax=Cochliobolus heterostrophus TaxID=5016 RepID=M2UFB3_COCH5|nr:uncharacterized protein COCC4DRAFT_54870 [Bipolaris maydis ATCC 48331]EMD86602.1 hypothetical protein COCHEDRAFT_1023834 [Bipolaris maydis C5]ENH98639.1 hypothetical protein COCC4DRAFT_54870 [Bipolaris maydis ATCC 48331]KAJ6267471.1 hypothetical protein PSV08DRAFT_250619 [Bipolaris maydis]